MPDAIITSTESTFGTISGTFAADQSTIVGTVAGSVVGNLSGSVGVPGPAGPGVPAGGTAGQYLQKIDGVDYNTDWVTLNLSAYAPLNSPAFTGNPTAPTAALGDNDTSLATTAFVQQELLSGTANAKNLEVYVRNQTGSTLAAGAIVYINGATGNRPTVTLAQANNDANSAQTFGFVKTAIANNGFGYVIVRGELENIDTSALTEGVQLYLSPTTPGAWTTTKPSAPQHLVYVGIVVRSHPTQGVILVAVQNGYELNELHDVAISSPTNGQVLKYNSSTGLWYNGTDSSGVAWGGITGTLSDQTDLQTALDGKYSTSNPAGYITSSALSPYLTSATAASTYQTIAGMSSYLTTSAAASTYYPLTNPSGYITSSALTGYATESWVTAGFYPLTGNPSSFLVAADIAGKANTASPALTGNVTITTNSTSPALVITQDGTGDVIQFKDVTSDTTYSFIDQNGKVNTVASSTTSAGFNVPHGTAPTSPVNGDIWTTTGNLWVRISGVSQAIALQGNSAQLSSNNTFTNASSTYGNSTAAGTINLGTGATISGATKAINIGTSGVAGSTTNITIGSTTGTSTTTLQGNTNGVTQSAGNSTTLLATTAFVTTADNLKANLASPTFTGTPAAPTAAADTNTTQLATTAYVVGQAGSATPLVDGTAAVGTSLRYARQDHVHPTDTSRAALNSPVFTGTPSLPTGTTAVTQSAGNNTTAVATTAFVTAAVPAFATETQAIYGTSSTTTISPLLMRYIMSNGGYTAYTALLGNYSSYVSGSGSIPTVFSNFVQVAITAANGKAAFLPNNNVSYHSFSGRGVGELTINWTKPVWFSFRFNYSNTGQIGDANTINRVTIGKVSSTFGDLSSRGIGVRWTAGTAGAFTVMGHNGSTLSTSASAVTVSNTTYFPTTNAAADFLVYSDGAGNVTLFCNNVQVATTTGGPSSGTSAGVRFTFETDNTTSTSGTVTCDYSGIRTMLTY